MSKLRYKLSKWLLWLANQVHGYTTPQWPVYGEIDNINLIELDYLKSYDPDQPLKQIWEGWVCVTPENAQSVIDDLQRGVNLAQTQEEQDKLNEESK